MFFISLKKLCRSEIEAFEDETFLLLNKRQSTMRHRTWSGTGLIKSFPDDNKSESYRFLAISLTQKQLMVSYASNLVLL